MFFGPNLLKKGISGQKQRKWISSLNYDGGPYDIEISPVIFSANHWTGFCMKGTSVVILRVKMIILIFCTNQKGCFQYETETGNTTFGFCNFKVVCNHFHNILRLFDVLPNFPFSTSETMHDYYLLTWYTQVTSRVAKWLRT